MHQRRSVAVILSASLLLSALPGLALAQDEAVGPFPAEGVEWRLASLAADGTLAEVPADVEVTLFMNGGDVFGSAGCNSYFGSYQIDATSLSFPVPFGSTQKLCEGPAQQVEDAYLPLLSMVAGWTIDEAGALSLSDAEGAVTLVFGEPPIEITATDVQALVEELTNLQAQIDQAAADVATLNEEFSSVNVTRLRNRIRANEEAIAEIDATLGRFRNRINASEEAIVRIDNTIDRLRDRIRTLETSDADQEQRISALEDAAFVPTPASE